MDKSSTENNGAEAPKDRTREPREPGLTTLVFGGSVRLASDVGVPSEGGVVVLEVEIDTCDMRIVDAACDCLGALGRRFLVEMLVGREVEEGLKSAIAGVRSRYLAPAQSGMVAALEDVLGRCKEHGVLERH